jgi:hypothetical protein
MPLITTAKLVAGGMLAAALMACDPKRETEVPTSVSKEVPAEIEVQLSYPKHYQLTVTNLAHISAIVQALQIGHAVPAHKCKSRGTLTLKYSDGRASSVTLLTGHAGDRTDLVIGQAYYSIPSKPVAESLALAGADLRMFGLND